MALPHTKKSKTAKGVKQSPERQKGPKHSQLGKAIIEGLEDIKKGNVVVIDKENAEKDVDKLLE